MDLPRTDLADRIAALPPAAQDEVGDFIDFLSEQVRKRAAWDRLLAVAPALEAAGLAVEDEADIAAEIAAARAGRRSQTRN